MPASRSTGSASAPLLAPLPLGIAAGLFLGKQIGIFGAVRLCGPRSASPPPPRGATWLQVYGVAMLCGIGFTMSLFIGALAFPGHPALVEEAKLGILLGSLLSALARLCSCCASRRPAARRARRKRLTSFRKAQPAYQLKHW